MGLWACEPFGCFPFVEVRAAGSVPGLPGSLGKGELEGNKATPTDSTLGQLSGHTRPFLLPDFKTRTPRAEESYPIYLGFPSKALMSNIPSPVSLSRGWQLSTFRPLHTCVGVVGSYLLHWKSFNFNLKTKLPASEIKYI